MHPRTALLLASLLPIASPVQAASEDDEAWITRYMASPSAPGLSRSSAQARTLEFGQLSTHVGRRVRFTLNDGRERRGIVEGVRGNTVQVRAQFGGGYSLYTLSRSQIRTVHLD